MAWWSKARSALKDGRDFEASVFLAVTYIVHIPSAFDGILEADSAVTLCSLFSEIVDERQVRQTERLLA